MINEHILERQSENLNQLFEWEIAHIRARIPQPHEGSGGIRSLLVATDFSVDARNAVARAAFVAAQHRAELALLHVVSGPTFKILRPSLDCSAVEAKAKLIEEVRRALGELAADIANEFHITAVPRVQVGAVLEEILTAAQRADILLLGARGLNPMRDAILGTTADRIAAIVPTDFEDPRPPRPRGARTPTAARAHRYRPRSLANPCGKPTVSSTSEALKTCSIVDGASGGGSKQPKKL